LPNKDHQTTRYRQSMHLQQTVLLCSQEEVVTQYHRRTVITCRMDEGHTDTGFTGADATAPPADICVAFFVSLPITRPSGCMRGFAGGGCRGGRVGTIGVISFQQPTTKARRCRT
jgi:hypothetical protein